MKHVALEHVAITIDGAAIRLKPGDILDDTTHPIDALLAAGCAIVPYDEASMSELVRKFVARMRRHGEPEGDLSAVLARTIGQLGGSLTVFVAQNGSDTTGDGSRSRPFATIARALREMPSKFVASDSYFRVAVIPPYTGPAFSLQLGMEQANEDAISFVSIEAYQDPSLTGLNDPRFTTEAGPITSSAAGTVASNMVRYTVPTGSITSAHIGLFARVFRAGVEVGRGTIAHIRTGASDLVSLATTRTSAPPWTPTAGDVIYVADLAVSLTGGIRVSGAGSTIPRIIGIKCTHSSTALTVARSTVRVYMSRFLCTATTNAVYCGLFSQLETFYGNTFPWIDANEALLMTMAGGHVRSSYSASTYALRTNGHANLTGWLIDGNVHGLAGSQVIFNHGYFRGRIYAVQCQVSFATGAIMLGREDAAIANPGVLLESSTMCHAGGDDNATIYFNSLGFAAGQPAVQLRRSVAGNTLRIAGFEGAVALTGPVVVASSFSEAKVTASTVTGPAGQDVRAGSTNASFAGIPIVDAATLSRVTNA